MTSEPRPPLIRVQGLGKTLRGSGQPQQILTDVTFSVLRGESVSVLGRSGSGKSTLLSLLAILDQADEGSYELDGTDVSRLSDRQACRLRSESFGFVFQRFFLLKHLTAEQNVMLSLLNGQPGCSRRERRRRTAVALDRVGIGHLGRRHPAALSGGEQQRVAIARALVRDPTVVFADEPTGALDNRTGDDVVRLLTSLTGEGRTLIMVTHDHQYAHRLDRLLILEEGQLKELPNSGVADPPRQPPSGTG